MLNIFYELILNLPPIHDMDDLDSRESCCPWELSHNTRPQPCPVQPADDI